MLYTVKGLKNAASFKAKEAHILLLGGSGSLSIIPGHASIANQVFAKFLSRLPHTRSDLTPPSMSKEARMKLALSELADIMEDPTIASRDPLSSLSFSCLPPEVAKTQTECLAQHRKGLGKAFSPLGPDGRPIRKYDFVHLIHITS